jgi:hypothetical protein
MQKFNVDILIEALGYWIVISAMIGLLLTVINAVWCVVKGHRQPYWPFVGEFLYVCFFPFWLPFWL